MIQDRIKSLIKELGTTVPKFGAKIGFDHQTIYKMMANGTKPSFDMLSAILTTYDKINPRWLVLGDGEMFDGNAEELLKEIEALRNAIADKDRIIKLQERQLKIAGVMEAGN